LEPLSPALLAPLLPAGPASPPPALASPPPARSPRPLSAPVSMLCFDALNFSRAFVPHGFDYLATRRLVGEFVAAAAAAGVKLAVFIDASVVSGEAEQKWRKRRVLEVASGAKNVVYGLSTLLGDAFRAENVPVHYSLAADNDDTLAAFAHAAGADVLSADGDFFRYVGRSFRVYSNFFYTGPARGDRLLVVKAHAQETGGAAAGGSPSRRPPPSPRPLLVPPPAVVAARERAHWLPALRESRLYLRGAPSPLVRALDRNPHAVARPLRRALYALLLGEGDDVCITEEFPVWNGADADGDGGDGGGGGQGDGGGDGGDGGSGGGGGGGGGGGRVVWARESVQPWRSRGAEAAAASAWRNLLLGSPRDAFAAVFPLEANGFPDSPTPLPSISAQDWRTHCVCCRSVVYELCAAALGRPLLDLLLEP
jgi:uncharacterized membrane protein YgcG